MEAQQPKVEEQQPKVEQQPKMKEPKIKEQQPKMEEQQPTCSKDYLQVPMESKARHASLCADQRQGHYRIVVMGGAGVGKTCLIKRFLYKKFLVDYKATVDHMYTEDYILDGKDITLDFLDTSGAYQFPAMRTLYITSADAFILVFSVDKEDSFEEVTRLRQQIIEQKKKDGAVKPIIIVANKLDLKEKKVAMEMAESTVLLDWEHGYIEASAKENVNVDCVFKELLKQAHIKVKHTNSMVRRRDSAPVFLPSPAERKSKRNSCKTC